MTQPGTELVREIIDSINGADVSGVLARIHPEFEWRTLEGSPIAGTYTGHEDVRRYVEDWLATFEDLRLDVDEITQSGEAVLVVVHGYGRGRVSGIEVENHFCQLWTLREGAAMSMREYETRQQALTDLES